MGVEPRTRQSLVVSHPRATRLHQRSFPRLWRFWIRCSDIPVCNDTGANPCLVPVLKGTPITKFRWQQRQTNSRVHWMQHSLVIVFRECSAQSIPVSGPQLLV